MSKKRIAIIGIVAAMALAAVLATLFLIRPAPQQPSRQQLTPQQLLDFKANQPNAQYLLQNGFTIDYSIIDTEQQMVEFTNCAAPCAEPHNQGNDVWIWLVSKRTKDGFAPDTSYLFNVYRSYDVATCRQKFNPAVISIDLAGLPAMIADVRAATLSTKQLTSVDGADCINGG